MPPNLGWIIDIVIFRVHILIDVVIFSVMSKLDGECNPIIQYGSSMMKIIDVVIFLVRSKLDSECNSIIQYASSILIPKYTCLST